MSAAASATRLAAQISPCPSRPGRSCRQRARVSGPLPDRGERPRARDHRRDPDGDQPGQRMTASAPLARVRDLGEKIEKVLAAGSWDRRRCHRRAGVSRQKMLSAGTSIVPPGPRPLPADTPGTSSAATKAQAKASFKDFAASLLPGPCPSRGPMPEQPGTAGSPAQLANGPRSGHADPCDRPGLGGTAV